MDVSRTLLAAVSFACSLLLLLVAGRNYIAKKSPRPSRALTFYGLLFLVSAFVLWQSRSVQTGRPAERAETPAKPPPVAHENANEINKSVASGSDTTTHATAARPEGTDELPLASQPTRTPTGLSRSARGRKNVAIRREAAEHQWAQLALEDRAYLLVSYAFDAVERWFMLHGSPAPLTHSVAERNAAGFPDVSFQFGTAELHTASREDLLRFAKYLRSQSEPSLIEIQSYSNEGGMEPFNSILTQARAEAVRKVLVENGVSTSRLLPMACGSQGMDSLGLSSHVRFVTRP